MCVMWSSQAHQQKWKRFTSASVCICKLRRDTPVKINRSILNDLDFVDALFQYWGMMLKKPIKKIFQSISD